MAALYHTANFEINPPLACKNTLLQPYCTALLDSLIDSLIEQPYGQPYWTYWTDLFHIVHMNLFQITRVSHNASFSRNQNVHYAENSCILKYDVIHNWNLKCDLIKTLAMLCIFMTQAAQVN